MKKTDARATFESLKEAVESGSSEALEQLYDDKVVLVGYSKNNMPSRPLKIEGKREIEPALRSVFDRETERQAAGYPAPTFPWTRVDAEVRQSIQDEVIGEDRFSYNLICDYGDGKRLIASSVCDVREGRIIREVTQETWDE